MSDLHEVDVGATEESRLQMDPAHRAAIEGVVEVLRALQDLPDEVRFLKDRITSNLLWVVTEFKPGTKHKIQGVRWRTPRAHALVEAGDTKTIRHEHVIERSWMIQFLDAHPEALRDALWNYPACLVTREEHLKLGRSKAWGWDRYIESGVQVIDAETGHDVNLDAAQKQLHNLYERSST